MYDEKTKHGYVTDYKYKKDKWPEWCQYCKYFGSYGDYYACYKDYWIKIALVGPDIVSFCGHCYHFNWAKQHKTRGLENQR